MFILIDYKNHNGNTHTMSYENFKDLKDSVISKLDNRGWYDKDKVDLRSLKSCVDYLTSDARNVDFKQSTSIKKYTEYRYGDKARNL